MSNETKGETRRHPLWKHALAVMLAEGVEYGARYEKEYFERLLSCDRDSMEFNLGVSEIRKSLEGEGFYLSGRNTGGEAFVILTQEQNAAIVQGHQIDALHSLRRAVTLGNATDISTLTDEQRERHERVTEKAERRLGLVLGVRRRPALPG